MRLSGHRDASAVGQALQHLQPQGQPLSSRHVRTVATRQRSSETIPRPRRQHSATHLSSSRQPSLERDTETDRAPTALGGMAPWRYGPQAWHNGRVATHFHGYSSPGIRRRARNVRGMAPWRRGPEACYNERFATHLHGAVHLGSAWRTERSTVEQRIGAPSAKRHRPARQKSKKITKHKGQTNFDFKEGEIHASGRRKDPSAEGAGAF